MAMKQVETAAPHAPTPEPSLSPTALRGRPLGEILAAIAGVSPDKVAEALVAQQADPAGLRFGETLVKAKLATEEQVLRALAIQLGLPFQASIDAVEVPDDLARLVPINFAKTARVLPLGRDGDEIRVAVADPLDTAAQDNLSVLLGAPLSPVVAPGAVIVDAINQVYDRTADRHDRLMEDLETTEDLESVAHELEEPTDLL